MYLHTPIYCSFEDFLMQKNVQNCTLFPDFRAPSLTKFLSIFVKGFKVQVF